MARSDSWCDFLDGLRETVRLLRPDVVSPRTTGASVKASVMLVSGQLQGCIESQVQEFLERVDESGVSVDAVPEVLRANLAKQYFPRRDKPKPAEIAIAHRRYALLWTPGAVLKTGTIKTDSLPDEVYNPWPDKVQELLKRCDLDLYGHLQAKHGTKHLDALKEYVGELVSYRNQVAHGGRPPAWTPADVLIRLRGAVRLARGVDEALEAQLVTITGAGWRQTPGSAQGLGVADIPFVPLDHLP